MIEILLQAERALSVGLLDRAETLYSQVARADPQNSIAVVGLARVTLDRGDDMGALELARKAAAIDPENPAAQNMVIRLEEILEYRDATALLEPGRGGEADASAPPAEPEVVAGAEAEPDVVAGAEVVAEVELEAVADAAAVAEVDQEAVTEVEPEAQSEPEPELAEAEPELAEAEPELAEAEPELAEARAEPALEVAVEAEAEPEPEVAIEAEQEPESEPEAVAEAEPDPEPEIAIEAEAEPEPEAVAEPERNPAAPATPWDSVPVQVKPPAPPPFEPEPPTAVPGAYIPGNQPDEALPPKPRRSFLDRLFRR